MKSAANTFKLLTPLIYLAAALATLGSPEAFAQQALVICSDDQKRIHIRERRCNRREERIVSSASLIGPSGSQGAQGERGPQGEQGPQGAKGDPGSAGQSDGSRQTLIDRLYGKATRGSLTIPAGLTFDLSNGTDLQYDNFTIENGASVTFASGTVLKCTGSFTNNGTITVRGYAEGGQLERVNSNTSSPAFFPPMKGFAYCFFALAEFGRASEILKGAPGGCSMFSDMLRTILYPGPLGGSGGGPGYNGRAGKGGGTLTVLSLGALTVGAQGVISANGENSGTPGGGGGGAGAIILASSNSVSLQGAINARGGNGALSSTKIGAGGGGGGGFLRVISPSIASTATLNFEGGNAGSNATNVSDTPRFGGSAGGDSVGAGGAGAQVSVGGISSLNGSGGSGFNLETVADPLLIFGAP